MFKKGKNVDNRSGNVEKRGTIAIYALAPRKMECFEACEKHYRIKVSLSRNGKMTRVMYGVERIDIKLPGSGFRHQDGVRYEALPW